MRSLAAVALASTLLISNAFAANISSPLAAGKPAGVKKAQIENTTLFGVLGVGIFAAGVALAASGDSNAITPAVTTTTTTTTTTGTAP